MDVNRAKQTMLKHYKYNTGAFYGSALSMNVGAGLIYSGILFPIFQQADRIFETVEGMVYVLTHECDIDPSNDRNFNESVLVCPIIKFEYWAEEFVSEKTEGELFGMLPDIAKDNVFRVFYFPPIPQHIDGQALPYGGLIFFNQITSTHVSCFYDFAARKLCALSTYGAERVDYKLKITFFAQKVKNCPD